MEQNARERTLRAFKAKEVTILVCTDVASRGIDVKDLTHVINYSLPRELDLYIHRVGRTGRGGKEGIAWSFVTPSHNWLVGKIEQVTGTKLMPGVMPSPLEVMKLKMERKLVGFLPADASKSKTVIAIEDALTATGWSTAIENMSKEEIVARFLSREIKLIDATPKAVIGKGGFAAKKTEFTKRPGFKKEFKKSFKKDGFKKDGFKKDFKKSGFKSFAKKKTIEQRAD
jgi:superfamily II DNA/RNA helicase